MYCRTWKNHQIIQQKLRENEEILTIFTVILMAALGTKNVDSAMSVFQFYQNNNNMKLYLVTEKYINYFFYYKQ